MQIGMVAHIKKHLENVTFVPFAVRMTDGREYRVPTIDHIYFPPTGGVVVISDDNGSIIALPALHMSGLVEGPFVKKRAKRGR
jgi:hypothetical protein